MTCTTYDEAVAYNAPIPYNGECVTPPVSTGNFKGGATIYVVHENQEDLRRRRKLRREDEEILFL
jgi:hypothetical protein